MAAVPDAPRGHTLRLASLALLMTLGIIACILVVSPGDLHALDSSLQSLLLTRTPVAPVTTGAPVTSANASVSISPNQLASEITQAKLAVEAAQLQVDRAHSFFQQTAQRMLSSGTLSKHEKAALVAESTADFYRHKAVHAQRMAHQLSESVLLDLNFTVTGGSYDTHGASSAVASSTKATRYVAESRRYWDLYHQYTRRYHFESARAQPSASADETSMEHKFAKRALLSASHRLLLATDKLTSLQRLAASRHRLAVAAAKALGS